MTKHKKKLIVLLIACAAAAAMFIPRKLDRQPEPFIPPPPAVAPAVPEADPNSTAAELIHHAQSAKALSNLGAAESSLKLALGKEPENPEVHFELSGVYAMQGDASRAVEALHEAVRIDPKFIDQALQDDEFQPLRHAREFQSLLLMHNRDIPEMSRNPRMPPLPPGRDAEGEAEPEDTANSGRTSEPADPAMQTAPNSSGHTGP